MTYRQLLEELKEMTDEQLDSTVTVLDAQADEFYMSTGLFVTDEKVEDRLDDMHPYLVFNESSEDEWNHE